MGRGQPTVVIGIGGTGKQILLALKKMIIENSPNGMQDYPLLKLLSIDADERKVSLSTEIRNINEEILLDEYTEIKRVGKHGLSYSLDLDNFPEIKEWYPVTKNEWLNPNTLKTGCHQHKPTGRFVFAWHAEELRENLYNIISSAANVNEVRVNGMGENELNTFTNVFICGSLCGGTGAGMFLDVANLVRFVAKQAGCQVFNYGLFALASIFDNIQCKDYCRANAYASLIELDHFQNELNYSVSERRRFYPSYYIAGGNQWDYKDSAKNPSFDYPYLFDKTNEKGVSFSSSEQFAEMAAKFIYLLTGSDVAGEWQSVSNNMWAQLGIDNGENGLEKPTRYASSGNTTIVYPRRKILQLCSYKLAYHYFETILLDSYGEKEINNLVDGFFLYNDDTRKINPDGYKDSEMAAWFSEFPNPDSDDNEMIEFGQYIQNISETTNNNCIYSKLVSKIKNDKKSILGLFNEWTKTQDEIFEKKFVRETSVHPRHYKNDFTEIIKEKISNMLNLREVEDLDNSTDEKKIYIRGSVVRTRDFLENLRDRYSKAYEEFKKLEEQSRENCEEYKSEFEGKKLHLEAALKSLIPFAKNIENALRDVLNSYAMLLEEKKNECVAKLIRQFFTGIIESGNHKDDGIIKYLDDKIHEIDEIINKFNICQKNVQDYIESNRKENNNGFNVEIFNFKKDVEDFYTEELAKENNGENYFFTELTDFLQSEDGYGRDYSYANNLATNRILDKILIKTEMYFKDDVKNINMTERLFEDKSKLEALISGAYLSTAGVYIRVDDIVMRSSHLNEKEYYVISIPNEREYANCEASLKAEYGKKFVCPCEEKEEHDNKNLCNLYRTGKCLKARILRNAPTDLQIILSDNKSEINIFKVKAGFPLRAITSVSGPYKEEYKHKMDEQKAWNNKYGTEDEYIHMFGNVKFADIDEKEDKDDLLKFKESFRRDLLITLIGTALLVDESGVACQTVDDKASGREPSLKLGKTFEDAVSMSESLHISDMKMVNQIHTLSEHFCNHNYFNNEDDKSGYIEIIEKIYKKIRQRKFGFTIKDEETLADISMKYFDFDPRPQENPKPFALNSKRS